MKISLLDDIAIFLAVVQQGSFNLAAKQLNLSNGLISRRIAKLESKLGVNLIKRTTRRFHLTPEGELLLQHALRIQQELNGAVSLIQSAVKKPKGVIRISAPVYFGQHYLMPIILSFLSNFPEIHVDVILNNAQLDPIKEKLDLSIRGAGFLDQESFKNSHLRLRLLLTEKVGLYASPSYLQKKIPPIDLDHFNKHLIISHLDLGAGNKPIKWHYRFQKQDYQIGIDSYFRSNDVESNLQACSAGFGIAKLTELNAQKSVAAEKITPILTQYEWGKYHLFALYSGEIALPKRTRLLLDFIYANLQTYRGLEQVYKK